jgi:CHAT domain-containing protein/tetratricopeptide (TPR) repeat protein
MTDQRSGFAGYGARALNEASPLQALSLADVALLQSLQYAELTATTEDDLVALMNVAGTDHALSPVTLQAASDRVRALTARGQQGAHLAYVAALLTQRVIAAGLIETIGPELVEAARVLLARSPAGTERLALGMTTAQALMRLGRVDLASMLLAELRPMARSPNDVHLLARAEADLHYDLSERDQAVNVLTEALAVAREADASERFATLSSLLTVWPPGKPGIDRWLDEVKQAAGRMKEPLRTVGLLQIVMLLRTTGRVDEARQVASRVKFSEFRALAGAELQPWIDDIEQSMGNALQAQASDSAPSAPARLALSGDHGAAADAFRGEAEKSRARGFRVHAFDNLAAAGKFYQMAGRDQEAISAFEEAFALFEHDVVYLPRASHVISRLASWPDAYTRAALAALALNDPLRAVDLAETGRSRAIGNRIGHSAQTRPPMAPPDLWEGYVRAWRAAVARAANQLIENRGTDGGVDVRDDDLDALRNDLLASGVEPEQLTPLVQPARAAAVVENLSRSRVPTTVLYSIRLADSALRFVRLTRQGAEELTLGTAEQQEILRACDHYVSTLREHRGEMHRIVAQKAPELVRTVGGALGSVLQRALDGQRAGRLLWIPQGTLVAIPLPACLIGGEELVDRAAVVVAPSLTMGAAATEPDRTVTPRTAAVRGREEAGRAPTDGGARVVAILTGQSPDEAAPHSIRDLNAAVAGASFVHLTCHGIYDWDDPLRSFLMLGSDVPIEALFDEGAFEPNALVLFGTCDSGTIAQGDINEAIGLPTACIGGGARAVVGAAWPVARAAAVATCLAFARELQSGRSSVEALQAASAHVRRLTLAEFKGEIDAAGHPLATSDGFRVMLSKDPNRQAFASPYLWSAYVHWGGGWRLSGGPTIVQGESRVRTEQPRQEGSSRAVPEELVGNWSRGSLAGRLFDPATHRWTPGTASGFQYRFQPDGSYEFEGLMNAGGMAVAILKYEAGSVQATAGVLIVRPSEIWVRQPDGRTTRPELTPRQYGWQVTVDSVGSVILVLMFPDGRQDVFYRR